jgi:hypothetical protein
MLAEGSSSPCPHLCLSLQVSFAFEEPRKQAAKIKSHTFKVALVASDCLLLGK